MMSTTSTESKLVTPSATLPLEGCTLRVTAQGGIARVVLEQTFANHHPDPLAVTYVLPLPADAAVSGFSFRVGDRRIEGEIDRKKAARERYEDAIARGHTAALLEQERSSLFSQEIGNVPPGARVVCEIVMDQKLRWLEEGSWEWRFPLAAAPRYLGEAGRVPDAKNIALDVAQSLTPRASLSMAIGDALALGRSPESPSHPLQCAQSGGGYAVELGGGNKAELDRDLVVRWPVAALEPSLSAFAERTESGAHALVTIVPPRPESRPQAAARDLIVLLDTSGSMSGTPLDQARRVAMALIDGLGERDTLELIEFSSEPRRFEHSAVAATAANKKRALAWLASLEASGGTEMREGILEALRPLRPDGQRQIVLITDGLIGFEQEIVQTIVHHLPPASRVHTVGVGSSVNRSLTGPAARAGKGVEIVIGLGEDPERAVQRLRARTEAPIVVDVTMSGSALIECAPAKIPDLYAGAPVLASAKVRPEGGEIIVRGRTPAGIWEERVRIAPADVNASVVAALFGREAVEDQEMRLAAGAPRAIIDRTIEDLGLAYRIATRLTSWVAVDKTPSVDPLAPTRREVVPQMLPHGMSVDGLGLRQGDRGLASMRTQTVAMMGAAMMRPGAPPPVAAPRAAPPPPRAEGYRPFKQDDADMKLFCEEFPPPTSPEPLKDETVTRPMAYAKVIHRTAREITFEIHCVADHEWNPEDFALLLLVTGEQLYGTVALDRSTRKAKLVPGQIARITIRLDEACSDAVARIIFTDHAVVVI